MEAQQVEVSLEHVDGSVNDQFLITLACLQPADLKNFRVWCCDMTYSFHGSKVQHCNSVYQSVLEGILAARGKALDASYVLLSSSDKEGLKLNVLSKLSDEGFVQCVTKNAEISQWILTKDGLSRLRVTQVLTHPVPLLRVRDGVKEANMELFELLLLMHHDKWVPHVKPSKQKKIKAAKPGKKHKKRGDGAVLPSPNPKGFRKGDDKIFWLGRKEKDMVTFTI